MVLGAVCVYLLLGGGGGGEVEAGKEAGKEAAKEPESFDLLRKGFDEKMMDDILSGGRTVNDIDESLLRWVDHYDL